jgi:hypothetical protein
VTARQRVGSSEDDRPDMADIYAAAARVLTAFVANQGGIKTLAYARGNRINFLFQANRSSPALRGAHTICPANGQCLTKICCD